MHIIHCVPSSAIVKETDMNLFTSKAGGRGPKPHTKHALSKELTFCLLFRARILNLGSFAWEASASFIHSLGSLFQAIFKKQITVNVRTWIEEIGMPPKHDVFRGSQCQHSKNRDK